MADQTLAKRARLETKARNLKAQTDAVKAEIEALDAQILENFAETGVSSVKVGGYTFYLRTDLFANHNGDKLATIAALKENGLAEFVREDFSAQTLKGWVRELIQNFEGDLDDPIEAVPEDLRPFVKVSEVHKVGVRKAS